MFLYSYLVSLALSLILFSVSIYIQGAKLKDMIFVLITPFVPGVNIFISIILFADLVVEFFEFYSDKINFEKFVIEPRSVRKFKNNHAKQRAKEDYLNV